MNGRRRHALILVILSAFLLTVALAPLASASPITEKKARLRAVQAKLQHVYHKADIAVERYNQASGQLRTVQDQVKQNQHLLKVAEYNLTSPTGSCSRAPRASTRRATWASSTCSSPPAASTSWSPSSTSWSASATATSTPSSPSPRTSATSRTARSSCEADKKAATKLVKERAAQKNEVLALQGQLEQMTAGLKNDIQRLQEQAAAAARAAAQAAQAQAAAASGGGTSSGGTGAGGSVPDPGGSGRSSAVAIAQRYLGVPYVWGGASPSGFDCSGLAMYVYAQLGIGLSHGATDQQRASTPVPISALQPGDLVFFGSASYSYHVGIYVGGGSMIHAPHTGAVVSYGSISGAWIGGRF